MRVGLGGMFGGEGWVCLLEALEMVEMVTMLQGGATTQVVKSTIHFRVSSGPL